MCLSEADTLPTNQFLKLTQIGAGIRRHGCEASQLVWLTNDGRVAHKAHQFAIAATPLPATGITRTAVVFWLTMPCDGSLVNDPGRRW